MQSAICLRDSQLDILSLCVWALPPIPTDSNLTERVVHLRRSTISTPVGSGMKLHYDSRLGWIVSSEQLVVMFRPTSMRVTVRDLVPLACQIHSAARSLANSNSR